MVEAIEYEDLTEKVYVRIRELIISGELEPGSKLLQEELSARLGISRTPLLAAFSRLAKEMLVEFVPRRGAFVRKLSKKEILDLFDIRTRLEPLGALGAASAASPKDIEELAESLERFKSAVADSSPHSIRQADFDFHILIMKLSGNSLLFDLVESHNLVCMANQRGIILKPERSLADHVQIFQSIATRNPRSAEAAMRRHLSAARAAWAATLAND